MRALRFSFDRAVRAPNLLELFLQGSYGQEDVFTNDPVRGPDAHGVAGSSAKIPVCRRRNTGSSAPRAFPASAAR